MRIELNVNRTRITVLGFTLALIVFASSLMIHSAGDTTSAMWMFLPAFVAFFIALVTAMVSLWLLMLAQCVTRDGGSEVGMFTVAEGMMYLSLSQTLAAVVRNVLGAVDRVVDRAEQEVASVHGSAAMLHEALHWIGGVGWFLLIYVGPVWSAMRNPLPARVRIVLLSCYLAGLVFVNWVQSLAYQVWLVGHGHQHEASLWSLFFAQWWQPQLWSL